jgi:hypothetical protein
MGDYDFKPSGSLKLKGVKEKKIKKKKEKVEKPKEESNPEKETSSAYVVPKTEAERRFEEIQRQRVSPIQRHSNDSWRRRSRRMPSRVIGNGWMK